MIKGPDPYLIPHLKKLSLSESQIDSAGILQHLDIIFVGVELSKAVFIKALIKFQRFVQSESVV